MVKYVGGSKEWWWSGQTSSWCRQCRLGADYARRGDAEPTEQDLDALARREADRLHVRRNRGQWIEGFRNGFARGFEEFSNQASNRQANWSRLTAGPDFPLKLALSYG